MVITAPLNNTTLNLVNEGFLVAMDDGTLLINAGRGKIVDTDALTVEVRSVPARSSRRHKARATSRRSPALGLHWRHH